MSCLSTEAKLTAGSPAAGFALFEIVLVLGIWMILMVAISPFATSFLDEAKRNRTSEELSRMANAGSAFRVRNGNAAFGVSGLQKEMYSNSNEKNVYGNGFVLNATGNLSTVTTKMPGGTVPDAPFATADKSGNVSSSAVVGYGMTDSAAYEKETLYGGQ